jgi:hypothetical protein
MVPPTSIPATAPFDKDEPGVDEEFRLDDGCAVAGKESVGLITAVTVTWDPSLADVVTSTVRGDGILVDISSVVFASGRVSVAVEPGIELPVVPRKVVLYLVEVGCR